MKPACSEKPKALASRSCRRYDLSGGVVILRIARYWRSRKRPKVVSHYQHLAKKTVGAAQRSINGELSMAASILDLCAS